MTNNNNNYNNNKYNWANNNIAHTENNNTTLCAQTMPEEEGSEGRKSRDGMGQAVEMPHA